MGLRRCEGSKMALPPLLWPVAYTTACTTVQAVISILRIAIMRFRSMIRPASRCQGFI